MPFLRRPIRLGALVGACVAAWSLAAPAAQAFSTQDKAAADPYDLPKFDLDEQLRNFKADGASPSTDRNKFEMPLGGGTLQFDVKSGSARDWFRPGGGFGPAPLNTREDFNRVVTPENLR